MRHWLTIGLITLSLPLLALGSNTPNPCQLLKLTDAEKLIGPKLNQTQGTPYGSPTNTTSCIYSSQNWSNRAGSGAAQSFLELTLTTYASPKAASQALTALQAQMQAALKTNPRPAKLRGVQLKALSGFGKEAFRLELPIPSDPAQDKPLVTRLYWRKDKLQLEVMGWALSTKATPLEISQRAAALLQSKLP